MGNANCSTGCGDFENVYDDLFNPMPQDLHQIHKNLRIQLASLQTKFKHKFIIFPLTCNQIYGKELIPFHFLLIGYGNYLELKLLVNTEMYSYFKLNLSNIIITNLQMFNLQKTGLIDLIIVIFQEKPNENNKFIEFQRLFKQICMDNKEGNKNKLSKINTFNIEKNIETISFKNIHNYYLVTINNSLYSLANANVTFEEFHIIGISKNGIYVQKLSFQEIMKSSYNSFSQASYIETNLNSSSTLFNYFNFVFIKNKQLFDKIQQIDNFNKINQFKIDKHTIFKSNNKNNQMDFDKIEIIDYFIWNQERNKVEPLSSYNKITEIILIILLKMTKQDQTEQQFCNYNIKDDQLQNLTRLYNLTRPERIIQGPFENGPLMLIEMSKIYLYEVNTYKLELVIDLMILEEEFEHPFNFYVDHKQFMVQQGNHFVQQNFHDTRKYIHIDNF